jgi:hypothetical protein
MAVNHVKVITIQERTIAKMDAWLAEMKDGLPRSNGGLSRKYGGKFRGHGIQSGASIGPQGTCRSGNWQGVE